MSSLSSARERVTVSMPVDIVTMMRRQVGPRGVSGYVTSAVRRQLELDALSQLVDEMSEASGGPLTTDELAAAATLWPRG